MVTRIPTRTPGVYKVHRGKGTVYVARWREVDATTGKARVRDKTFSTEAAARQYRAGVEHAQATGTYVPPNVGKVTVREVAEQWLELRERAMCVVDVAEQRGHPPGSQLDGRTAQLGVTLEHPVERETGQEPLG